MLLPLSLRDLCKSFSVTHRKTYFPFKISDINYRSAVFPDISLYDNIDLETYNTISKSFKKPYWDFKEEALEYCNLDCVALSEVIDAFNTVSFNDFSMNIHKSLTLHSYALKIFTSNFLKEKTLHKLSGEVEDNIRKSF